MPICIFSHTELEKCKSVATALEGAQQRGSANAGKRKKRVVGLHIELTANPRFFLKENKDQQFRVLSWGGEFTNDGFNACFNISIDSYGKRAAQKIGKSH